LTLPFSFSLRFFLPFALTNSEAVPAGTALLATAPVNATCAPCPDPEKSPGLGRLKARVAVPFFLFCVTAPGVNEFVGLITAEMSTR
jgi:hypothetical protein